MILRPGDIAMTSPSAGAVLGAFVLALAALAAATEPAAAADWMFCVVSTPDLATVWVSPPFAARRSREATEEAIAANALGRRGKRMVVQCPLPAADRRRIEADVETAIRFNRGRNAAFADFSDLMPTD